MGDNLKAKTINALKWSTVDRIGQQAVQFIVGLILARLLNVEDFGLVGLLLIFNALSFVLVESGFGQSLVRKKATDDKEFSSIFYFNIFIGIFIYIILFFFAPVIASFFQQPQLTNISRVSFIVIPFNALYLMPIIKLGIHLDYKNIAKANILSTITSGTIGVVLALNGFGVWALVWQLVSYHFIRFIVFFIVVKWQPIPFFSFEYIREHWKFSINLLGTGILNVIFNNIFIIVLGRFFPLKETGFYTQANKLSETANYTFISILTGSTYNIFSQIQYDLERLKRILNEFIQKVAIVVIPAGFFLIASANELIITLIGEQWKGTIPYFQLICIANLVAPLYLLNINALNARGLSGLTLKLELIKKSLILLTIISLFHLGGKVMIVGYVISCWIAYFASMIGSKKNLNYYWNNQLKSILPALGIGIFIGTVVFAISHLEINLLYLFIIEAITASIIYVLIVKFFYRNLYHNILGQIKDILQKK